MPGFKLTPQRHELKFRVAQLISRTQIASNYYRLRFGGDFADFNSPGCDDHIRLFFPPKQVSALDPQVIRECPSREYTPLSWGPDFLEVEFMIHHSGLASDWADSAPISSPIGVGGPRGSKVLSGEPGYWFLAGDETAVPAIRRYIEAMPASAVGEVIIETHHTAPQLLLTPPDGVKITCVPSQTPAEALAAELEQRAASSPGQDPFVFVAAEQRVVKPGRQLLDSWGVAADRASVRGYWKQGETEYHAPH